jgi:hypothetical protein
MPTKEVVMKILERMVQTVNRDDWQKYRNMEELFAEIEARVGGFPRKRYYVPFTHNLDRIVWEREWPSFAAMEEAYEKSGDDPDHDAAMEMTSCLIDQSREMYSVLHSPDDEVR